MKRIALYVILATALLVGGCTLPAFPGLQPTAAPTDAAAPATAEGTAAATGPAPVASPPVTAAATTSPEATGTVPVGTAPAAAPAGTGTVEPTSTGAPGGTAATGVTFATHRDPEGGFAIDYPASWHLIVPPAEARRNAQAYTASIRSFPPDAPRAGREGFQPGESGVDVTVWRTVAGTFEEVVAERRQEIANSEMGTQIAAEETITLAGGLPAIRWELQTGQMGRVIEVTTLLNGNRVMVDGMGDLTYFDAIATSLRPLGEGGATGTGVSTATPAAGGTPGANATPAAAGTPPTAGTPAAAGTPPTARTPAAVATTASGQVYTDAGLGLTLTLPAGWELCQDSGWSRLFCRIETNPDAAEFPRFWVTVLPAGFTNEDFTAYNFLRAEDVRAFLSLPIGGSHTTNDTPGYSTFKRLSDVVVDGRKGVVVENAKVWEGGPDTKDRRVLVQIATSTYVFGTYYSTPEELAEFQRVLAGVEISAR